MTPAAPPLFERAAAALAALQCAAAVALGAYAAHGAVLEGGARLERASLYLFLHGIAVYGLCGLRQTSLLHRLASLLLLAGSQLFAASLAGSALFGFSSAAAPWGGMMMIAGWLLAALAVLRRST